MLRKSAIIPHVKSIYQRRFLITAAFVKALENKKKF
jgi:hypothetical protein